MLNPYAAVYIPETERGVKKIGRKEEHAWKQIVIVKVNLITK